jgi:hypothetical protein
LYIIHTCGWRPFSAPLDHLLHRGAFTFEDRLDALIGEVSHPSPDAVLARLFACVTTEVHALHKS